MTTNSPVFGQLVIGPAGSGKTTYCHAMSSLLQELGRNVITINLDPANDVLPFEPTIDISSLVTLKEVMETMDLGPNGGLLYCIDFLDENFDWLQIQIQNAIDSKKKSDPKAPVYVLVDSPGQVELFTTHDALKRVLNKLFSLSKLKPESSAPEVSNTPEPSASASDVPMPESKTDSEAPKPIDLRLVTVNIVDSHYSNEPSKFISVALNSLSSMIHLETPHINVLSKADLIQAYGKTDFGLDFYCEVLDLNFLVDKISDDPFLAKYKKLTQALAGIIEDYSLLSFIPMDINNNKTIVKVLKACDRANGYYMNDMTTDQLLENYFRSCDAADFEHSKYEELLEKLTS